MRGWDVLAFRWNFGRVFWSRRGPLKNGESFAFSDRSPKTYFRVNDPDHRLRVAAIGAARGLSQRFDDLVPLGELRKGFLLDGERMSFGSFQRGIYRAGKQRGDAALTITTAPPVPGKAPPYDDEIGSGTRSFTYRYRAGPLDQPDNRALRAAYAQQVPLIYFRGIAPSQYMVLQPVFVTSDDPRSRAVRLEVGLPVTDLQDTGLQSASDHRAYAMQEVRQRLHQHRFRLDVLRAYRNRCVVCSLRETALVQAAHIVDDSEEAGIAAVVNGLALCAIHHLAYDRNLMGIDPEGVVHIGSRVLKERDGPMLKSGLQAFHGARILGPTRLDDRPDPNLLETRYERFRTAGA
jgi:putative restriction endonuclease